MPAKKTAAGKAGKVIDEAELAKHTAKDDAWLLLDGTVYDVTEFLENHPGGEDVMLEVTNKDCTDEFEDTGHSAHAREMLTEMKVGDWVHGKPDKSAKKASEGGGDMMMMLVPALLLIAALYYQFVVKAQPQ